MKRTMFAALLAVLTAATAYAIDPGQTELEVNGWFRYTNQSSEFKVTEPTVSRFLLDRGYVRLSHQWTPRLFSKMTVDVLSSDKYADGASIRLKEAFLDLALPVKDFTLTAGLQKHYFGLIYSWDYTHPEKELADDRGVCASADYGVTVNGFLPKGLGELQLGVYNGEGYKIHRQVPRDLARVARQPPPDPVRRRAGRRLGLHEQERHFALHEQHRRRQAESRP